MIVTLPKQVQYTLETQSHVGEGNPDLNVPPALARNLRTFTLDIFGSFLPGEPDSIKVDLSGFAHCKCLEGVEVYVGDKHCFRGGIRVCGLGRLPAACKGVVLVPYPGGVGMFVEPESGWQVNAEGGPGGKAFWRRSQR